ncbi:progestin and adipoQ receptor family member 3-like [Watersipora subatra]|uniref:progestin and adipoQ receptor family member 3-like n=1 Tax=Watersipora subatra TaxID=2589382 RepID=UPI00355B5D71
MSYPTINTASNKKAVTIKLKMEPPSTTDDKMFYKYSFKSHNCCTILDLEVDNQCGPNMILSHASCLSDRPSIDLYKYEEIPRFLKGNPYIRKGYRVNLPASHCFSSLLVWNNESINVWSHLLGFVLFSGAMFTDCLTTSTKGVTLIDCFYNILGLLCFMICMLLSAGFHLFYCHSKKACRRWLAMDLAGISIGLIGCYLPGVHLAFYCHQSWRHFYLFVVFLLGVISFGLQLHPRFLSNAWGHYRMLLYSCIAGYGVIPAVHWIYLSGGFHTDIVQIFYGKIVMIYILALLAVGFYVTKFPECLFPGKMDYIGSSHQWWHIIVVVAFMYWHNAGLIILQYRIDVPCQY